MPNEIELREKISKEKLSENSEETALLRELVKLNEQNPMLGYRGVRLCLGIPELIEMQARAILEAASKAGKSYLEMVEAVVFGKKSRLYKLENITEPLKLGTEKHAQNIYDIKESSDNASEAMRKMRLDNITNQAKRASAAVEILLRKGLEPLGEVFRSFLNISSPG